MAWLLSTNMNQWNSPADFFFVHCTGVSIYPIENNQLFFFLKCVGLTWLWIEWSWRTKVGEQNWKETKPLLIQLLDYKFTICLLMFLPLFYYFIWAWAWFTEPQWRISWSYTIHEQNKPVFNLFGKFVDT